MCWKMGNGSRVLHDLHGRYDIFPLPHLQIYNFQAKSLDLFANVLTDGNFICPSLVAAHNLVLPPTPRPRNVSVYVYYFDQVPHSLDILARTHAGTHTHTHIHTVTQLTFSAEIGSQLTWQTSAFITSTLHSGSFLLPTQMASPLRLSRSKQLPVLHISGP